MSLRSEDVTGFGLQFRNSVGPARPSYCEDVLEKFFTPKLPFYLDLWKYLLSPFTSYTKFCVLWCLFHERLTVRNSVFGFILSVQE